MKNNIQLSVSYPAKYFEEYNVKIREIAKKPVESAGMDMAGAIALRRRNLVWFYATRDERKTVVRKMRGLGIPGFKVTRPRLVQSPAKVTR